MGYNIESSKIFRVDLKPIDTPINPTPKKRFYNLRKWVLGGLLNTSLLFSAFANQDAVINQFFDNNPGQTTKTGIVLGASTSRENTCTFQLGFKSLRDRLGADTVGNCLENEHFNPLTGTSIQKTTLGTLTWDKKTNHTTFLKDTPTIPSVIPVNRPIPHTDAKTQAVLDKYRSDRNLPVLNENPALCKASSSRLADIQKPDNFNHNGFALLAPNLFKTDPEVGYLGENLATGYKNAQSVVDAWDHSPKHRENMQNPRFNADCVSTDGTNTVLILGQIR